MLPIVVLALLAPSVVAKCDGVNRGYQCDSEISHQWGQYAPYFAVTGSISNSVPSGCKITFVNLLSRHGARYPTAENSPEYADLIHHIQKKTKHYASEYAFLKHYDYTLGVNAEQLTTFGQNELKNSGIKFFNRYKELAQSNTPFFRSSGLSRVVQSALNFSQGFHQARGSPDTSYPYQLLVMSEDAGCHNTLHASLCKKFEKGPFTKINNHAEKTWRDTWIQRVKHRVNTKLDGAKLNKSQTINLMDMCPFDTVADPEGNVSPFCGLFAEDEWSSYDYYKSLDKWYGDMQGNPLGPTQGVGFAAELIARMTQDRTYVTSPSSYTSINHTLDSSQATFPLGDDYPLYADFSHDDDLASIFAALGLYNRTEQLSNTTYASATEMYGYSAAWTVPFAARAYFEKMKCDDQPDELVRVIINDRVVPLQNCGADSLGRCTLDKFVASQSFVTSGGHWGQCSDSSMPVESHKLELRR